MLDGRPITSTPSPVLLRSTISSRPSVAFVDKTWLSAQRHKYFDGEPVRTTYDKVRTMSGWEFDPYIAGLLLAMAQCSHIAALDEEIQVFARSEPQTLMRLIIP